MDMGLSCYFPFVGTKSFVRFTRIMVYNGRLITTVWWILDFLKIFFKAKCRLFEGDQRQPRTKFMLDH